MVYRAAAGRAASATGLRLNVHTSLALTYVASPRLVELTQRSAGKLLGRPIDAILGVVTSCLLHAYLAMGAACKSSRAMDACSS